MPSTPARPLIGLAAALVLAACSAEPSGQTLPTAAPTPTPMVGFDPEDLPRCDYPEAVSMPAWIPPDLPLPPGTYAAERLDTVQGYRRALMVAQTTLREFTDFVLERFPDAGWVLGRGDTEPGEVDFQFSRPPAVGAMRSLDQLCRPGMVLILLLYAPDQGAIEAPVPITPAPGSTPLPIGGG